MAVDQVWTLEHEGHRHRVVAGGDLAHVVRWYVDGELLAERKAWEDRVTVHAPADGVLPDGGGRKLLVHFSGLGTPRRATLLAADDAAGALTGFGGVDLVPEPGSRAAAYEARVLEHPHRHAALAAAGGVAKVLVPVLLGLVAVRFAVRLPWPDLPRLPELPDLPDLPLPSVPWPDLPDVHLPGWARQVLAVLKYVWPVVFAYLLARAEVRRRRAQDRARRAAPDDGEPGPS